MRRRFATLLVASLLLGLNDPSPAGPLSMLANAQGQSQPSGTGEVRLTASGDATSVVWSPDSGRLLFTRSTSVVPAGQGWQTLSDLWEVSSAGGAATRLATNAASPAYSPDGLSIAYLSLESDGRGRLWLLSGGQHTDLGPADWGSPPAWSRDGVSVQVRRDGRAIGVDRQGRVAPAGVSIESSLPAEARAVAGSPGGSRVSYLVFGENGSELWVAGSGGTDRKQLLQGELEFFGRPAWSPDGRTLVLDRTPSGSETAAYAELWLVAADGSAVTRLSNNLQAEGQPAWSPDGRSIAFLRDGDLWLRGVAPDVAALPAPATEEQRRSRPVPPALDSLAPPGLGAAPAAAAALTPPATIRVKHSTAFNHTWCPNYWPADITVIPFEQYLKWVVPSEMGAGQPVEALRAQAVAARSYAWLRVLNYAAPIRNYDVTDWTEYQAMCPGREDPRTNAVVDSTAGQYVSYQGAVANTMYASEPGDPTWSYPSTQYLIGVDDPVSFGQGLYGHGYGMSQRGAYRWAGNYGWNYQQILSHYYTGVVIQLPGGGAVDMNPLGSLLRPWANWWVNSNRTVLVANASDDRAESTSVSFVASFAGGGTVTLPTNGSVLDLSGVVDQGSIVVTTTVTDGTGRWSAGSATWGLDRSAPSGTIAAPAFTAIPTVTLGLSASHSGPAGPVSMTLSNDWRWSALDPLIGHSANSGRAVADSDSLYGVAWLQVLTDTHDSRSFGPFTSLAVGRGYRAWFRLKTSDVLTAKEVAYLEVIDNSTLRVLGLKRVRGIDFRQANVYQDFYVDFYLDYLQGALEFTLTFRGKADLWYDRVMATTFPAPLAPTVSWSLPAGEGPKQVQARYVDGAGNISPDYNAVVTVDDTAPTAVASSPAVAPAESITVTWIGTDTASGVGTFDVQVRDGDGPWTAWQTHTTALSAVYSGDSRHLYSFRARATDKVGNTGAYCDSGDTSTLADGELAHRPLAAGWNLVGVALSPATTLTAESLRDSVAAPGSPAEVASWQDGDWLVHAAGESGTDFPLEAGRGYFVRAAAPATWTLAGLIHTTPVTVSLTAGWNLVSVPQGSSVATAGDLAQRLQDQGGLPRQVLRWRAGAWDGYLVGTGAAGFAIEPGRGYFVYCENPCVWSP